MTKRTYILENLDCANCAEKIRSAISKLPNVQSCEMSFASRRMSVEYNGDQDNSFIETINSIANSIENGVVIYPAEQAGKSTAKHEHGGTFSCGGCDKCEHEHEHHSFAGKIDIILLCAAVVLLILAVITQLTGFNIILQYVLYVLSAILAGYDVFISGIKSLFKLQINENILMTIAVIAAFILGECFEAAMVAVLFAIGEIFEKAAVGKSRKSIEELSQIRPDTADLVNPDGSVITVNARDVKIGDIIQVNPFERIPLDGIVTSGVSSVDCSALTGESVPLYIEPGVEVKSGSVNNEGLIEIKVTGEFENSTASRILAMVEDASMRKGKVEQLMTRFAKIYTPAVVLLALAAAFLPPLFNLGTLNDWVLRALVLLVASCPCAVVISVPLCYYMGIGKASTIGVLVKGSKFVESGSKTKTVLFDKTGTLTKGSLEVKSIISTGDYSDDELLAIAACAEAHSNHPAALAICEHYKNSGIALSYSGASYIEIPACGVIAVINGKTVKCGSARILENPNDADLLPDDTAIYIVIDGRVEGGISVGDVIRSEAKEAIEELRKAGINRIAVLSGDNKLSVDEIAKQCGIDEIYSELLPQNKLEILERIKVETGNVMFVGDGINDSPVLTAADTGAAMGLGTEAAIESADLVISSDNLSSIAKAIKTFKRTTATAKINIIISLLFKAVVIILALFGYAPMWLAVIADVGVTLLAILNAYTINRIRL